MKKRLLFFIVLLLGLCAAVPSSAEEEKITLTAVFNDDGSITFTGSTTAHHLDKEDMVCIYKEGDEPESIRYLNPIFFYMIGGNSKFSVTHPVLYCLTTYRNDGFIDKENLILEPGKYFAVIEGNRSWKDGVLSNRAYFTVTEIVASPTPEITPKPVTPTPEVTPSPSEPKKTAVPTASAASTPSEPAAPTASEKAAPTPTSPSAPDDSSQSGSDFLPIILCVVLGILFCIELAVIISVLKKKKG